MSSHYAVQPQLVELKVVYTGKLLDILLDDIAAVMLILLC